MLVQRPRLAMAGLTRAFDPGPDIQPGIHPTAIVDPDAQIGAEAAIGPFVLIGAGARELGWTQPAVSQHLAKMRMARMVTTRHEGTRVLYRLTDEHAVTLVLEAIRQAEHIVKSLKAQEL